MTKGTVARDAGDVVLSSIPDDLVKMALGMVGSPEEVRDELNRINFHLHSLYEQEPDLAMRIIGAYSSRVTELERLLFYAEARERAYTRIRTMDARPLLEELDRQFKIHSRLMEGRAQDLAMNGIRR